jgi:hypothetical protein
MKANTRVLLAISLAAILSAVMAGFMPRGSFAFPAQADLLTPADVSKVMGVPGVKLVPYDPSKGAGGNLNFALPGGQLVLIVNSGNASLYSQAKAMKGAYAGDIKGLGDEAFSGKVMGQESVVYFRKGNRCVSLSSFFDMAHGMKPYLTQKQLRDLAAVIVSRM